ncbi:rsmI [Symbiodinium necroappetens]|uniref:RsmI protein n=1 Tax=Symbiodinium necroappetens TaxID=1628268 RepID=A0A812LGT6_9DINO|nr:rsmI [Symbiodinium necroappetens]
MEFTHKGVELFAIASLAVEAIFALKVLCLACSYGQLIRQKVRNAAAALGRFASQPYISRRSTEEKIRFEEVCQLRVQMIPFYMGCCIVMSQLGLITGLSHVTLDGWVQPGGYWTSFALCVANMTYLFNPRVVSKATMNFWYVLHMAFGALFLAPWSITPAQTFNASLAVLALIRLPAILFATTPFLVVGCNLGVSALLLVRTMSETWAPPACDILQPALTLLCGEVLGLALTTCSAFALNGLLHHKVRRDTRHKNTTSQLVAASSLLSLTCDAVVELDADLRITKDSPQLATMLLRDRAGATVKGMMFTDLMPTEHEAERAYEILSGRSCTETAAGREEGIHANAFHTRLVDSCSSKFRTEVFQVAYSQVDGQVHHLIGLRDFTDQTALAGEKAVDAMEGCVSSMIDEFSWEPAEKADFRDRSGGDSSESEPGVQELSVDDSVFLYVDMQGLRVAAASLTVAHMSGKDLGELLSENGLKILQQIWEEATGEQEDLMYPLHQLKIHCSDGRYSKISGRVEVAKASTGEICLLLYFKPTPRILRSYCPSSEDPMPQGADTASENAPVVHHSL